jgi:hypothetical protein
VCKWFRIECKGGISETAGNIGFYERLEKQLLKGKQIKDGYYIQGVPSVT